MMHMIHNQIPKQHDNIHGHVLVIGAGFIGQGVIRALSHHHDVRITACDINERNLSVVDSTSKSKVVCELADCSNYDNVHQLIHAYKPTHIINTAAFKHVRFAHTVLSQQNMLRNNVNIIQNIIRCTDSMPWVRITHTSTDKSVYPTTYMGWTKLLSDIEAQKSTNSTVVRFGNVYGSSGSIVDLIASGVDVTINDPTMVRHFITLDDAVNVTLTAMQGPSGFTYMPSRMTPVTVEQICTHLNVPIAPSAKRWVGEKAIETLHWADESWIDVSVHIQRSKPSNIATQYVKELYANK